MRFFAAAGLVTCVALAQTPSINDTITSHITANDLKGDVSFLASDALEGRATPSRGLDLAGEFIASQFRRAGLEPAGNDQYFQDAAFETVTLKQDEVTFSIEVDGKTIQAAAGSFTVQANAPLDLKSAPVVPVGSDEMALAALTPDRVNGKVVVMVASGGIMRAPSLRATLKPALVVVLSNAASGRSGSGSGGRGGRPQLREANSTIPTIFITDPGISGTLGTESKVTYAASIHIPAPEVVPAKLRNVVGILRGSDPQLKDTYLMLTAHYDHLGIRDNGTPDHIYNGANDDASGTASLIEIASALAALPVRPKRSVVFIALFGEELGDLGSHYYAQHPIFPLAKTVADVNLEQLGRTDDTEEPHVHMFNLTGYDFTDLPAVFNRVGKETGIRAVKNEKNSDPYFTRSDNAAFAQAGVPSTTLSVAYDFPDYHKEGDEWQKLDYDNMALVDRTIALAVAELGNSAETTKWNEANPKTAAFVKARQATLNGAKQ